jgi:CheY-like chemotaxis protein
LALELVTAQDGQECLSFLQGGDIDLAFIDTNMPGMSGMEALGRARFAGNRTFVVLMSMRDDDARLEVARQLQVYEYLVKPFTATAVEDILSVYRRITTRRRTLVVDDSGTIRKVMRRVLQRSLFRLTLEEASNGEAALKLLDAGGFGVVFLDYNMPGLNGQATLERIRGMDPETKVIMVSAWRDEDRVQATLASGASAFLFKPFFAVDVDRALHTALGLKLPQLIATWTQPAKPLRRRKPVEFCPMDATGQEDTSLHFVDEAWLDAVEETEPARD